MHDWYLDELTKHCFILLVLICLIVKVPAGKVVKVTFKKFLLLEPGKETAQGCPKDYVKINEKK